MSWSCMWCIMCIVDVDIKSVDFHRLIILDKTNRYFFWKSTAPFYTTQHGDPSITTNILEKISENRLSCLLYKIEGLR